MKPRLLNPTRLSLPLATAIAALFAICSASAQNGTWTQTGAGPFNWGDAANWSGTTIANGVDFTASFTPNITLDQTVNLAAAQTIGNITFTDSSSSNNLTISGANILTLDRTDATKPTINVTQSGRTLTINSVIDGNDGLLKSGAGDLALRGNNTFTGGIDISGGRLTYQSTTGANVWGAASNVITFTGNATLYNIDGAYTLNRGIQINNGVAATMQGAFGESTNVTGAVTGSGTMNVKGDSNGWSVTLSNTANTFTGAINITNDSNNTTLSVASLGSSTNAITVSNLGNAGTFTYTGSAAVSRGFAMGGTTGGSTINASGAGALTLTSFSVPNNGAKTLTLGGTSTVINTFQGSIVNSGSGATALTKANAGTWALSGTNTYSGATTFNTGSNGMTIFQGLQALSPNTAVTQNQISSGGSALRLLDDSGGTSTATFTLNTVNGSGIGNSANSIFVGNNSTTNGGSNASSTATNNTIAIGKLTMINNGTSGGSNWAGWNSIQGANGYRLLINGVDLPTLVGITPDVNAYFIPTTANVTLAGTIRQPTSNAARLLTLQLDGTSSNNLVSGVIRNSADTNKALNVLKSSSSTWTLSGSNDYTGTTTVTGGLLRIDGSLAAGSAVTVSGGSISGEGNGTTTGLINGTVLVSSTGGIDLRNSAIGTLTLASTLNITGAAGANNLRFDMGNASVTNDRIDVAGATTATTTGAAVIDLNWLGGTSGRTPGTYTLIGGAGELDATNFAKFSLATTAAFGQTYALVHDLVNDGGTGNLQLTVTDVTAATPAAFWAGGGNNWSTTTNWRDTLAGGGAVAGAPDYQTNVTFSTATPVAGNLTTNVLDVDFDINSLTFTNASGNVTIGGTKTLTLGAAAVNGNTLGNGIDSQKATGTNTISAKVGLAASQTWTVASGGTLAVSGVISDFGLARSLTKAGAGTLTLSATNTYTGGTVINGGTVSITNHANLGGSGRNITFGGSATLNGSSASTFGALAVNSGTATFGSATSYAFTSTTGAGNITFNGQNNSAQTLDLSNASGFTGTLRTNIGGTGNVPTKGIHFTSLGETSGSRMQFGGTDGNSAQSERYRLYGDAGPLTMTTRAVEFLNPGGGSAFDRALLQNDNTNAANKWVITPDLINNTNRTHSFELGGVNTGDNEFAGAIINSTNGAGFALSLIKQNAGNWFLTNANNTYTGATTISGGTLVIGGAGRLGSGSYAGNIANAGTFRYSSSANQTLSGIISGAGALTKDTSSSSILTLSTSTNTYTGATNVLAGTLRFAGSSSGTLGAITVGGTSTPVLDIQAGSYTQGAGGFFVGAGAGAGIVNQTGGTVTWNSTSLQLLIGNGLSGTYNLSGGSVTTLTGTPTRGVMLGVNSGGSATFNLSGTGVLTVAGTSRLMIGRSDATQINTTNLFSQTGGTATISDMTMGGTSGGAGSGNSATLSLTGGTFTAAAFSLLSAANNDVSTITIGGTAVVTLPNLPTARGSSATATMNFDGGTLRNSATGTFITGLTNAFIMDDGAKFDTSLNSTTISQDLLTHGSSLGGGLIKIGANTLTLTGTNTYTGDTAINAGTLLLSAGGSIANSANITLASSATLDVSTLTAALTLGSGQSLKSSATGANPTATVTTVSGNDLTLSAGGLSFTAYDGTNGNSATNAPLTVAGASAGELKLNGAPVTVTTTSSLANGTYVLVAKSGSALVTGTPGTLTLNGAGADGAGSLSVVGDQLVLTIGVGPGPLDHFAISTISSPQTVGTPITGITLTAQDVSNNTVTGFTGTVTFSGTAGITGTSGSFTAGVLTGVTVTPSVVGASRTFIVTDGVSGKTGTATFTVQSLYDAWATANGATGGAAGNPDSDGLTNLQEYAFGTDPTASTGVIEYSGGVVTQNGVPKIVSSGGTYYMAFGRRADYVAAGLTYTVEFSAGLDFWEDNNDTTNPPVQVATDGTINALEVPFVDFITTPSGSQKPTFARVKVELAP